MAFSRLSFPMSETILLLWMTVFFQCSIVTSVPVQSIILNSTGNYNTQAASWTFDLNYRLIPSSSTYNSSIILWVVLKLLGNVPLVNSSSLFAVSSNERFQHVEIVDRNSSDQGNVTIYFDHVYSGNYKLKVDECRKSRFSCFHTIHESDLGFVETHLNNINVTKMNISISTTPTDIGGISVSFAVQYFNVSNTFLPFNEFLVSLFHSDGVHSYIRKVLGETRVEFFPCTELTSANESTSFISTDCFHFPSGEYITRIDPIDSRCNFPEQIVASIKRPCRRYIITNVTISPTHLREGKFDNRNTTQLKGNNVQIKNFLNCSMICQLLNILSSLILIYILFLYQ